MSIFAQNDYFQDESDESDEEKLQGDDILIKFKEFYKEQKGCFAVSCFSYHE